MRYAFQMMRALILALVAAAAYVTYVNACTCFPTHPQVQFCQAKFGKAWDQFLKVMLILQV